MSAAVSTCQCPWTGSSLHRTTDVVSGEVFHELMATGAVVVGRRTFDIAGGWRGDHHDGVPIFVLTRQCESEPAQPALVNYVIDVETAMNLANGGAGEKDVVVHGARTAQLALAAGVLDELQIHLIPVLLGQGRCLFEHAGPSTPNWNSSGSSKRTESLTSATGPPLVKRLAAGSMPYK